MSCLSIEAVVVIVVLIVVVVIVVVIVVVVIVVVIIVVVIIHLSESGLVHDDNRGCRIHLSLPKVILTFGFHFDQLSTSLTFSPVFVLSSSLYLAMLSLVRCIFVIIGCALLSRLFSSFLSTRPYKPTPLALPADFFQAQHLHGSFV